MRLCVYETILIVVFINMYENNFRYEYILNIYTFLNAYVQFIKKYKN